jgi:RNA polymerase sigma-70 factor (ECF subfamily)
VQCCLAGDESAATALVECFQHQVFGLCLRMLRDRHDAEDVTQETFVRAIRSLHRWDQERDFRPWLFAIAGNRCRTWLANRTRRPAAQSLIEESMPDDSPDRESEHGLVEEVNLALDGLREDYRQAFLLFHQHELSYAEIAEALDCPVGTIKTWIHRARGELARRLRQRGVVEGPLEESHV